MVRRSDGWASSWFRRVSLSAISEPAPGSGTAARKAHDRAPALARSAPPRLDGPLVARGLNGAWLASAGQPDTRHTEIGADEGTHPVLAEDRRLDRPARLSADPDRSRPSPRAAPQSRPGLPRPRLRLAARAGGDQRHEMAA